MCFTFLHTSNFTLHCFLFHGFLFQNNLIPHNGAKPQPGV